MSCFPGADSETLRRFRDGDRETLEGVYRAYVGSVARTVAASLRRHRYGGDPAWRSVAEELADLVQEVFMRAFEPRTRKRFDGVREYGPFLHRIASNVVVDFLRRKRRQPSLISDPTVEARSAASGAPPPEDPFDDPRTTALVTGYLATLPFELRRVHEALYILGLSQREAAARLGLGRQVIRTLEAQIREGLRRALHEAASPNEVEAPSVPARMLASGSGKVW